MCQKSKKEQHADIYKNMVLRDPESPQSNHLIGLYSAKARIGTCPLFLIRFESHTPRLDTHVWLVVSDAPAQDPPTANLDQTVRLSQYW